MSEQYVVDYSQYSRDVIGLQKQIDTLTRELEDYKESQADKRRLVREMDVIINGEDGAAKQVSLCDMVGEFRRLVRELEEARALNARIIEAINWACGTGKDDFVKPDEAKQFWWRSELTKRAGLIYWHTKYRANQAKSQGGDDEA